MKKIILMVVTCVVVLAQVARSGGTGNSPSRSGEFTFSSSLSYTSTGSLQFTNKTSRAIRPSSIGVEFNTAYAATVTVSRVRGTVTNVISTYEGQSAVTSVGFLQSDLVGYVFINGDTLQVEDDSNTGTNSTVTIDIETQR